MACILMNGSGRINCGVDTIPVGAAFLLPRRRSKEAKRRQKAARKQRLLQRVFDYKAANPCACGESRPQVLEFHHKDPAEKDYDVMFLARRSASWSKIWAEIEKCAVKCANCHKAEHYRMAI